MSARDIGEHFPECNPGCDESGHLLLSTETSDAEPGVAAPAEPDAGHPLPLASSPRRSQATEHAAAAGGEVEALWVVTELSVALWGPPPDGEPHPETAPVGPFPSREAADAWAVSHVRQFRSGSWSIAPLCTPQSRGGEVAPAASASVEPTSKLPAATTTAADTVLATARRLCCGDNPAPHHAATDAHSQRMAFAEELARAARHA